MAKLNNLNANKVQERQRQVRTYGTKTDLASTVVERGSTHWTDGSNVNIDGLLGVAGTATVSGTLRVTGLLDVTGTFNGSGVNNLDGTNNLSGDNNLTGPTTIDGVLTINGDTSITGLLDITGDTTVAGNFEITTGGLFKSGTVEIRPDGSADFGDLHVDTTGKLTSGQFELNPDGSAKFGLTTVDTEGRITSGNIQIDPTNAGVIKVGSTQIQEFAGGGMMLYSNGVIRLAGLVETLASITLLGAPSAPPGSTANVWMDSAGELHRI